MTFASASDSYAHRPRLFVQIDGFPFTLCETLPALYLTLRISGDLNGGANEWMQCYINGVQIGGNLETGFQDSTLRTVIEDFDISNITTDTPVLDLTAIGGAGVSTSFTAAMEFTITSEFGESWTITIDEVWNGLTQTASMPIRTNSVCLMDQSISFGTQRLSLETLSSVGMSASVSFHASKKMLPFLARRKREIGYVASGINTTDTTVTINKSAVGLENQIYFIGAETLFSSSSNASKQLLSTQRGLFGSNADSHFGGSDEGEGLFSSVPGVTGRRMQVWCGYENADGSISNYGQIATLRLDDAPTYQESNIFELTASDLASFFQNRKCYTDINDINGQGAGLLVDSGMLLLPYNEGSRLEQGLGMTWGFLSIQLGNRTSPFPDLVESIFAYTYVAGTPGGSYILIDWSSEQLGRHRDVLNNILDFGGTIIAQLKSAKQVYIVRGGCIKPVLTMLLSKEGNGANSAEYDLLKGSAPATSLYDDQWGIGAKIDASEIDIASFEDLIPRANDMPWSWALAEETVVGDLLRWLCLSSRAYWYVSPTGQLTVKPFNLKFTINTTSASQDLDEKVVLMNSPTSSSASEKGVAGSFKVKTNFTWNNESTLEVNYKDAQTLKMYPDADQVIEYEYPMICVDQNLQGGDARIVAGYNPMSIQELNLHIRRIMKMNERGFLTCSATAGWKSVVINVGESVNFTNAAIYDFDGAYLSQSNSRFLVIGKKINPYAGTIDFDLVQLEQGRIVCQSGVILSRAGNTYTFDASDPEWKGADPSSYFQAGMNVSVFDPTTSGYTDGTVVALPATNEVTLSFGTGGAGAIVMLQNFGSNAATPFTNMDNEGIFCVVDGTLGATEQDGSRLM